MLRFCTNALSQVGKSIGAAIGTGFGVAAGLILHTEISHAPEPVVEHDHTKTNPTWITVFNLGKSALRGEIKFSEWPSDGPQSQTPAGAAGTNLGTWLEAHGLSDETLQKLHVDESLNIGPGEGREILCVKEWERLTRRESNELSAALARLKIVIEYSVGPFRRMPRRHYEAPPVRAVRVPEKKHDRVTTSASATPTTFEPHVTA